MDLNSLFDEFRNSMIREVIRLEKELPATGMDEDHERFFMGEPRRERYERLWRVLLSF